jgi:hypothetical protein
MTSVSFDINLSIKGDKTIFYILELGYLVGSLLDISESLHRYSGDLAIEEHLPLVRREEFECDEPCSLLDRSGRDREIDRGDIRLDEYHIILSGILHMVYIHILLLEIYHELVGGLDDLFLRDLLTIEIDDAWFEYDKSRRLIRCLSFDDAFCLEVVLHFWHDKKSLAS